MNKIDLTKQVIDKNGDIYKVVAIALLPSHGGDDFNIEFNRFIGSYENYIDPKDAEIERLKAIINELKNPTKPKSTRKHLSEGEWKEIVELIRKGVSNIEIAAEYGISDSGVSKRRVSMRKMGERV